MQWIINLFNLQWLFQPSVSIFFVGVATFLSALGVLLIAQCFTKLKILESCLNRAVLITAGTCVLILLYNFGSGKGGGNKDGGSGETKMPVAAAVSPPPVEPMIIQSSNILHIELLGNFPKHSDPDFSLTIREQESSDTSNPKTIRGNINYSDVFWKTLEKEFIALKKRHPTGRFLFTLTGVHSAQVEADIRKRLEGVFEDRLLGMDTIYMIGEAP